MSKPEKELRATIMTAVSDMGFELYGCELCVHRSRSVLTVYIDAENGVSLGDCANVSRQLSATLDVEDLISGRYDLEVSSPGIDRPLFDQSHFEKALGKKVKLRLHQPQRGQRNFIGKIKSVQGEHVTLETDQGTLELTLDAIEKARLIFEF